MVEPILCGFVLGTIFISILGLLISAFGHFLTSTRLAVFAIGVVSFTLGIPSSAYPVFAQQLYSSPVDSTGKVVCANWHLASLPVRLIAPHSIFPESIFDVVVSIPTDRMARQLSSGGELAPLNVGGVIALPEGFTTVSASDSTLTQVFNADHKNAVVFGPERSQQYSSVVISCQAEEPDLPYLKYPLVVGGNRGRGQIYPDGELSNNNSFRSQSSGVITRLRFSRSGAGLNIALTAWTEKHIIAHVPVGLALTAGVEPGAYISSDALVTANPNVGGFGQAEASIVIQSPSRILYQLSLILTVLGTQLLLVLKKKQYERSQLAVE